MWSRLKAIEVKLGGIKRRALERWPFRIPGQFQGLMLFLLIRSRQPHLFPLLLIHNLPDGALCLIIKIVETLTIINLGSINLRIPQKDSTPYLLLGLLQAKVKITLALNTLYLPNRLRCVNLLIELSLDEDGPVLVRYGDVLCLEFDL